MLPIRNVTDGRPRSIIKRERARIPEVISGHEAMVDPDCPCCQMLADMPGPTFWHLDGCNNDDDFAFDTCHQTREQWEQERREWDERSRRFDAEWAERERLGVTGSTNEASGSPWTRSFSSGDVEVPIGIRVFGLGCQLAELLVGLRAGSEREATSPESQRQIDLLNRDFGNLREILQDADSSLGATLIEPVVQRFADDLNVISTERPDLVSQCESLAEDLFSLLDPPSGEHPSWIDEGDSDIPF